MGGRGGGGRGGGGGGGAAPLQPPPAPVVGQGIDSNTMLARQDFEREVARREAVAAASREAAERRAAQASTSRDGRVTSTPAYRNAPGTTYVGPSRTAGSAEEQVAAAAIARNGRSTGAKVAPVGGSGLSYSVVTSDGSRYTATITASRRPDGPTKGAYGIRVLGG